MNLEEMKQVLDALHCIESPLHVREIVKVGKAMGIMRKAIEAAEAEKQEPVAYWNINSGFSHCMIDQLNEAAKHNPAPLYTHPQPKREPLTEWLPIETAPKDGTAVLVMRDIWPGTATGRAEKCTGHNTYVAAGWADVNNSGEWVCYMDRIEEPICPIEPTHWMPLPPPPIEAAHSLEEEA